MLEPLSPQLAVGEKPDKEEGALVIPANSTVREKPINDTKLAIQKQLAFNKAKVAKRLESPGTAQKRMAESEEKPKKSQKSRKNTEDHLQLKKSRG